MNHILPILLLVFALTACGGDSPTQSEEPCQIPTGAVLEYEGRSATVEARQRTVGGWLQYFLRFGPDDFTWVNGSDLTLRPGDPCYGEVLA